MSNIYDRSIGIVFGILFFGSFWNWWKLIIWSKFMFSFYPKSSRTGSRKSSITQEWLIIERYQISRWVTLSIFFWLVYDISSHLNDLILTWNTLLQLYQNVSHQNSRLLYEIFQFVKQAVIVIWHADSNFLFIMELKKR